MGGIKLSKKIKKFKKKSPWPAFLYRIGLAVKSITVVLTGFSLVFLALFAVDMKLTAEAVFYILTATWTGRAFLIVLGLSLIIYQLIEFFHKSSGAEKKIKKLELDELM
jgi:hypothetical protein